MKSKQLKTYKKVIILLMTGLLCCTALQFSATSMIAPPKQKLIQQCNGSVHYIKAPTTTINMYESKATIESLSCLDEGTIILDTEFDDRHPSIAVHNNGLMAITFELSTDGTMFEVYPENLFSLDNGQTWEEIGYFPDFQLAEYSELDDNEDAIYSGVVGPANYPSGTFAVQIPAEDPTAMSYTGVDWAQYNVGPFQFPSISCHTIEGEEWNWGGLACVGDFNYQGADIPGVQWQYYHKDESTSSISWATDEDDNAIGGFVHSDFVIDQVTGMSYAVYDHSEVPTLFVRKTDFGSWDEEGYHPGMGHFYIGNDVDRVTNPAVDAHNDAVVIVAEMNGNIVCFYSTDGLETVEQSLVAMDASLPDVQFGPDGTTLVCSYIIDGALYSKTSDNFGAQWTDEKQFAQQVNDEYKSYQLYKGLTAVSAVWEDTRDSDIDIYFGTASDVQVPIVGVSTISGGFGVKATISNTGTAEATNIEWSIKLEGGAFIGGETTDTIASIAPGESIEIKTNFVLGLGATEITVTAGTATKKASGTVLLFFVLGL